MIHALYYLTATSSSLQCLTLRCEADSLVAFYHIYHFEHTILKADFDKTCYWAAAAFRDLVHRQLSEKFSDQYHWKCSRRVDVDELDGHDFQDGCCEGLRIGRGILGIPKVLGQELLPVEFDCST